MAYRYPTTSPSMSVIAMSVSGVTSPSMLKAVRASRTATLKEVQPRYASFPMRPARLSPTRCQNSTTPSAPAFSIMSSMREARATSIMEDLRAWPSHERTEDLLQVRAPFLLRLRGDRVPFDLPESIEQDRQEALPMRGRHVRCRRADFVVRHRDDLLERAGSHQGAELGLEVLRDLLVLLELLRLPEFLDEQDPREPLQFPRDRLVVGGEDLRGDRLRFEQMADHDRRLHDVREDGLHLRDLDRFRREEDEEGAVSDAGDDDRARLELLDGHHHVLPTELVADVRQAALQEIQQAVLAGVELVRDRGGEDAAVHPEEHRDVQVAFLAGPPEFGLEEQLQVADRVGSHGLVDLARVGHLAAPPQPVRTEEDLEGFLRRVVVVPVFRHPLDPIDHTGGGLHRLRGLDRLVECLDVAAALLFRDMRRTRADHDAHAAGEQVRVHAFAVVDAAHLQELQRAVEGASDRIVLEVDGAVGEVDRQEDVLPDRLAGLRVLLDGAQDDAEFLQGVEQLADQLALFQLLRGRPDDRGHRVDHDASGDVVVRPRLHELGQLLLDHLLEIAALEVDEEEAFLVVLAHVEAHEVRLPHDLLRRLLEGHVQRLLALLDALHQELDCEGGLARPARAEDHHGRLGPKSAFDQVVESRDSAGYFLHVRHGRLPLGPRPQRGGEGLAGWNVPFDAWGFLKQFRPGNLG